MTYKLFRLDWDNGVAQQAAAGEEGFWLAEKQPLFVLTPIGMTIQFVDFSVSGGVHHRTRFKRYALTSAAQRLDPFALQPQDFAEEWLTQPWSEMESRSAAATRALHEALGGGFAGGEYLEVTHCAHDQPVWLIGFEISYVKDKELPKPQQLYLQVRDLGDYRYRMESESSIRPPSCKAEPETRAISILGFQRKRSAS